LLSGDASLEQALIIKGENTMTVSTADFLNRLRAFVENEANAQREALNKQWNTALHERVVHSWVVDGVRVSQFKDNIIRLTCNTNVSRFREGDLVVLHRGDPRGEIVLYCNLQYDGETDLELSMIRGNEYFLSQNLEGWIMDRDWFDSSPFYLSALNEAADSNLGCSIILPFLQSSLRPKLDYAKYERAKTEHQNAGLNEGQIESVAMPPLSDTGQVWSVLNRTESVSFKKPSTGKIAVMVINHYED
jgi:DNA replication ATP-dependent helicase Dna2